jgi:hypothetical protein
MKSFAVIAAVAMEASSAHFVTVAEAMARRQHHDSSDPYMIMSQIMASGQASMAQAQNQREKAVTMLRGAAVENFDRAAASLGDAIGKYASELASHELALETAVNASAIGLAKNAPKPGEFDFEKNHQRSKLKVEIDSAKQQLAHGRHKDAGVARQATEAAKASIEGEAGQMAIKLGNLDPEVQKVEEILQQHIIEATEAVVHPAANASETNLGQLVKELQAKEAETERNTKAARKELQDAMVKAGFDLQKKDQTIMDNIDATNLEKLNAVFGKALKNKAAQKHDGKGARDKAMESEVAQMRKQAAETKAAQLRAKLHLKHR